ncbi:MAG: CBS domain-containing protein [Planctomycetota bacterium]|jgi:CBS domain-containing protein
MQRFTCKFLGDLREPIFVKRDTEIYDAIQMLVDHNITGLPVVDDDMTLEGIITEKDVLPLLYDIEARPGKVEDFMTKEVAFFDQEDSLINIADCLMTKQEDSLINIADCLMTKHFRRVPITSGGKLVGVVSRKDIIACILKLRHTDAMTS